MPLRPASANPELRHPEIARLDEIPDAYTQRYSARDFAGWRRLFSANAVVVRLDRSGRQSVAHIDRAVALYARHAATFEAIREEWSEVSISELGNLATIRARYRLRTDRDVREGVDLLTLARENGAWKIACLAYEETRHVVRTSPVPDAPRAATVPGQELDNLADALARQARAAPRAIAVHGQGFHLDYTTLDRLTWHCAALLSSRGVAAGDVLALSFGKQLPGLVALLATARIGATAVWIPVDAPALLRAKTIDDCRVKAVASDRQQDRADRLPHIAIDLAAMARSSTPIDERIRCASPGAPWMIILGSGSTGSPRRIPISHRQFMAQSRIYETALTLTPQDRVGSLLSMDAVVTRERYLDALFAGASVVLDGARQADPMEWVRASGVTILWSTVIHAEGLLAHTGAAGRRAPSSLRALVVGSSTVSESLRTRIESRLTDRLHVYYGTNEVGLATLAGPDELHSSPQTVGRAAAGVRVEIVDAQDRPVHAGQVGLVRIATPGSVDGYADDPEGSAAAFRGGWFHPGDLGRIDADGRLDYCGRADQMMVMNGINIYPAEIEAALASHPAVRDAAAMALAHPMHQQVPVCAVALHPGRNAEARELLDHAFQRLGPRRPWRVLVFGSIPRNAQGKLIRGDLRKMMTEALGRGPADDASGEA